MNIAKRIGNFIFFLNLISFFIFCAAKKKDVEWQILSTNQQPLTEVQELVPFVLTITLNDFKNSVEPKFGLNGLGLKSLIVLKKFDPELYITTINNFSTKKAVYKYIVVAPKIGHINLGKIVLNGSNYTSEDIQFDVVPKNSADQEIIFNVSTNKTTAYVGEKLKFKIYFESPEDVTLQQITFEDKKYLVFKNNHEKTFKRNINGVEKKVLEIESDLFVEKSGQIMIPPKIARISQDKRGNSFFFHLIMPNLSSQDLYSNVIILNVLDLPDANINGIGQFNSYKMILSQNIVKRGMPASLKIILQGDGNIEYVKWPTLNFPQELRITQSEEKFDINSSTKTFEYILQGLKEGTYHIPEQIFSYFDPDTKKIKTLLSNSLEITIKPSDIKSLEAEDIDQNKKNTPENNNEIKKIDWEYKRIPTWMFWLLFLFPLILIFIKTLILFGQIFAQDFFTLINRKIAFLKAKKQLKKAVHNKQYGKIYELFINLFSIRLNKNESEITNDFIFNFLKTKIADEKTLNEWQDFFIKISALRFSNELSFNPKIIQDSFSWLKKLERLI